MIAAAAGKAHHSFAVPVECLRTRSRIEEQFHGLGYIPLFRSNIM